MERNAAIGTVARIVLLRGRLDHAETRGLPRPNGKTRVGRGRLKTDQKSAKKWLRILIRQIEECGRGINRGLRNGNIGNERGEEKSAVKALLRKKKKRAGRLSKYSKRRSNLAKTKASKTPPPQRARLNYQ